MNSLAKYKSYITNPRHPVDATATAPRETLQAICSAVQRLQIVGALLGEHGQKFTARAARIETWLGEEELSRRFMKITASMLSLYDLHRGAEAEEFAALYKSLIDVENEVARKTMSTGDFVLWRSLMKWVQEDLLLMPSSAVDGIVVAKQKCSFCAEKGTERQVLQACGRCKRALYCDKQCQKLHWKEHTLKCAEHETT
jgi:hypothetical protein